MVEIAGLLRLKMVAGEGSNEREDGG